MGARGRSPARRPVRIRPAGELVVGAATAVLFWRATGFPLLNWDDGEIFVRNGALYGPGVLTWALTTRFIEHYQPLSWIVWAGIDRTVGLTAATAHALTVLLHAGCAALVCALCARLAADVDRSSASGRTYETAVTIYALPAVMAALVWAVHPLRVEAVAWASAMPYPLALLFALAAALAWIDGRPRTAAAACALSLLARPIAFLLPLVLWIVRRPASRRDRVAVMSMAAVSLAVVVLESSARAAAGLEQFGVGPRLTLAAAAPWTYLWRTIWPVDLTPIDPLALAPQTRPLVIVCGSSAAALLSLAAWRWRRAFPLLAGSWGAYLFLLAPAMGIVPSGLQATADRYAYLPGVALAVAMTDLFARLIAVLVRRRVRPLPATRAAAVVLGIPVAILAALTWRQSGYWSDSVVLWTRAVDLDASNDVALYNLGSALAERGRRDEAIARYEAVLQIVPNHDAARRNRDLLVAQRLEEEANGLAANRNFDQAIDRYAEAVRLDPKRTHSHAALGIALTERGRYEEARPHLQTALDQGASDAAVPNALAFVLARTGHSDEAVAVLREALQRHPDDVNIRRNLEGLAGRR